MSRIDLSAKEPHCSRVLCPLLLIWWSVWQLRNFFANFFWAVGGRNRREPERIRCASAHPWRRKRRVLSLSRRTSATMQWKKLSYFKLKDLVKESLLYFSFKLLQLTFLICIVSQRLWSFNQRMNEFNRQNSEFKFKKKNSPKNCHWPVST